MANGTKTPVTLRERVKAALKIGDEGKVMSFFDREVRSMDRSIKTLTHNKSAITSKYEVDLEQLNDKIEDAQAAVIAAYDNVKPENVATNALQESYSSVYWDNVDAAEAEVERLEERKESLTDIYNAQIEDLDDQIATYNRRKDIISA